MTTRITSSYQTNVLMRHMHRNLGNVLKYQEMAATLRRVNSYADDPRSVGSIQRYRSALNFNQQYLRNVNRTRSFVDASDTSLLEVSSALSEVRELILREASALGTATSNDQSVVAVEQLVERIVNALNSTVDGNYIFSGHKTNLPPFLVTEDGIIYQGDEGEITAQVGPHTEMLVNIPGSELIGSSSGILTGMTDMAPRLQATDSLSLLNLGQGIERGSFLIRDGTGTTFTIDLSGASTIQDVFDRIDGDSGGAVSASVSPDGTGIQINGTGPLSITEDGDGQTAQSLGLLGESDTGVKVGLDIRRAPTHRTALADIPSLSSALPLGSIVIQIGDSEQVVDFGAATEIADLQSILNGAVPELTMEIDGAVLSVVSGAAASFTIRDADGSTTASDLGLAGTGSPARLFGMLEDLQQALESHDKVAIRSTLTELEAVQEVILGQIVKVGSKENILDSMTGLLNQRSERLQANLSLEWDADLSEVATNLSKAETVYEATLMVTSRLMEVNLMHYLR